MWWDPLGKGEDVALTNRVYGETLKKVRG